MVLLIGVVASALLRDGFARQSWADYPFAYGGLLMAVVGVYYAVGLAKATGSSSADKRV